MNPLLARDELPAFDAIRAEHVGPALDALLADAEAALERAVGPDVADDYDALSAVLDVAVERLHVAWNHVCHLQAVADTPALRAAHAENLPRVVAFDTRLGADERLYAKVKTIAAAPAARALAPARRKVLADSLRDFVLGGAELRGAARDRHAAVCERLAALSRTFGDHVLDATDGYTLDVAEADLDGVPRDVVDAARDAARDASVDGCRLTLQQPCYFPVLRFASNRALRETMFRAFATRASDLGPSELDNTPVIDELLRLRAEQAALLGQPNYVEFALVPKMAASAAEVEGFVRDLAARARPHAERELGALRDFAARELGIDELQAWDRAYASEKLSQSLFAFSSDEVKRYFTAPRVLDGLFDLVARVFDVAIVEDRAPAWHPSVRYFRVTRGGRPLAAFYLDAYARAGKQPGAWMDEVRTRWRRPDGTLQLPTAHLVCNFAPPSATQPSMLTHDDVLTLLHEFGHGLHHMLTCVDELAVSGIRGVEHDAVELPSQFMENFGWEFDVLRRFSAHADSGEPLPRELFDKMVAARHFQAGMALLRQCEYALLDLQLHLQPDAAGRVQAIVDAVNTELQPAPSPPFVRLAHSFSHLFDGGYAAGYYGYAWAEVLSSDAYSAFEEAGVFDAPTAQRFRDEVLEVGGSREALSSFVAFRGRAPRPGALLRHLGLAA